MAKEDVNFLDIFAPELGETGKQEDAKTKSSESEESTQKQVSSDVNINELFETTEQEQETEDQSDLENKTSGETEGGDESSEDVTEYGEPPASDSTSTTKSSEDIEDSPTLLFARFLSEQGNLTSYDEESFKKQIEEEGEDQALSQLWNNEAESIRNELLETYDQDVKEYIGMLDSGVDPNTAKDIASNKQKLEKISKTDLEDDSNEELRKDLIKQRYKVTTKFSDKKIDKLVEQAISLGEDVDEATEALEDLTKHYEETEKEEKQKVKQQQEEQRKSAEQQLEQFKKDVESLDEVVPGMPLTKKQKQNIIDKLTKPVKEVQGHALNSVWAKRQEDPFKFDTTVAVLDDLGIFDGKWDKLTKRVKTDTVNKLKKSLDKTSERTRTGAQRSYGASEDETQRNLNSMKDIFG